MQNASLRENILFGQPYDDARFRATVRACALDPDIAILPDGELTEIGERGVNISGASHPNARLCSLSQAARKRVST